MNEEELERIAGTDIFTSPSQRGQRRPKADEEIEALPTDVDDSRAESSRREGLLSMPVGTLGHVMHPSEFEEALCVTGDSHRWAAPVDKHAAAVAASECIECPALIACRRITAHERWTNVVIAGWYAGPANKSPTYPPWRHEYEAPRPRNVKAKKPTTSPAIF